MPALSDEQTEGVLTEGYVANEDANATANLGAESRVEFEELPEGASIAHPGPEPVIESNDTSPDVSNMETSEIVTDVQAVRIFIWEV